MGIPEDDTLTATETNVRHYTYVMVTKNNGEYVVWHHVITAADGTRYQADERCSPLPEFLAECTDSMKAIVAALPREVLEYADLDLSPEILFEQLSAKQLDALYGRR